ncbi:hypothetical protein ACQUY5_16695 [Bacillus cereus]|uniref:hypothetical protein n=1 Tax=Bacillus cereus TaxID=1396 RepID=UPI003D171CA0
MKQVNERNLDYKTLSWLDLFDNHEELIIKMKEIDVIEYKRIGCTWSNRIVDLQVSLMIEPKLTKEQTKVLQSLAGEIHRYYNRKEVVTV